MSGNVQRGSAQGSLCPTWVYDYPDTDTTEAMWSPVCGSRGPSIVCVFACVSDQVNMHVIVCLTLYMPDTVCVFLKVHTCDIHTCGGMYMPVMVCMPNTLHMYAYVMVCMHV